MSGDVQHERSEDIEPKQVRSVRLGHGANCSSLGSVVDTLFATAAVGAAVFAAVVAALATEPVKTKEKDKPRTEADPRGGVPR
jgi:hypothetical protein